MTPCLFGCFSKQGTYYIQYRAFIKNAGTLTIAYNAYFFEFVKKLINGRHTLTLNARTDSASFDEETISIKNPSTLTFSSNGTIALFASNSNGTVDNYVAMRLYACRVHSQSSGPTYTYYRDFVPCIDPSGAVGLYDLLGKKFYRNNGTGTFTAGPPV